jgi:hypothetical protein
MCSPRNMPQRRNTSQIKVYALRLVKLKSGKIMTRNASTRAGRTRAADTLKRILPESARAVASTLSDLRRLATRPREAYFVYLIFEKYWMSVEEACWLPGAPSVFRPALNVAHECGQ